MLQYVEAANQLAAQPQWYNSLTSNCTTVVMTMIRTIVEDVPLDWRVLANGYLPEYAHDQGVLAAGYSTEELRERGSITAKAQAQGITQDYSIADPRRRPRTRPLIQGSHLLAKNIPGSARGWPLACLTGPHTPAKRAEHILPATGRSVGAKPTRSSRYGPDLSHLPRWQCTIL